jgi:hypothetical protein
MVTRRRIHNKYRIELRERDHGPAHVHLTGGGFDVVIQLDTLASTGKWPRGARAEALAWIRENRHQLLEDWKKWHP